MITFIATTILARGGGGGSSSGGSGGGSFGGGGFYSGAGYGAAASAGSSDGFDFWIALFVIMLFATFYIFKFVRAKGIPSPAVPSDYIDYASSKINKMQKQLLESSKALFLDFQKSWSEFDIAKMKKITTEEYFKRMTLELGVLKNYERQNKMENVEIKSLGISDQEDYTSGFDVYFVAFAKDTLMDTREGKEIFTDSSTFSEIWHFKHKKDIYVLDGISQTTEELNKLDSGIQDFASKNKFYYNPDFGWLMMPSKGAIFGLQGFGNADINNHVIGYYKNKIVEFYSYEPKAAQSTQPLVVAQAILPKRYDDILVTEKSWYDFKPKAKGLEKVETESNDFNKKFSVWAARPDRATSFELLATNFMEKIYRLEHEINIEVIDNVLYLYSPDSDTNYQDMLEVLDWAFEEMRM